MREEKIHRFLIESCVAGQEIRSSSVESVGLSETKASRPTDQCVATKNKCKASSVAIAEEDIGNSAGTSFVCLKEEDMFNWRTLLSRDLIFT